MKLEDATLLATRIERHVPGIRVIAIGQFLRREEITDATPWRISVEAKGMSRPWVLSNEGELTQLILQQQQQQQQQQPGMLF